MIIVTCYVSNAPDLIGIIPRFLDPRDPRPAVDQFNENYAHGGGWSSMTGWVFDPKTHSIKYPGDPALLPIASMNLREETIFVYQHAWVCIVQPDGSFEIARMD